MTEGITIASDWLDTDQVAERLHVTRGAVRKWRTEKTGPAAHKFGRHLRYHVDDVDAWAKEQSA